MTAQNQDIAPGNNPDKLTNAQVGEGYRLLTREEIEARLNAECDTSPIIQSWCDCEWYFGYTGNDTGLTYRVPISAGRFMPEPAAPQIDWKARAEKAEQERDRLRDALEERTDQYNQATEECDGLRAEVERLKNIEAQFTGAIMQCQCPNSVYERQRAERAEVERNQLRAQLAAAQEDKALLDEFDRLREDVVEGRQVSEDDCEAELVGCYWKTPMVQSMSCREAIRAAIDAARKEARS